MHRHGYHGRKLSRQRDQRRALLRGLSVALIEHGSIETTLPKAKELRPRFEKLVTKARHGDLHARRQLIASLDSVPAAHKLMDQIVPGLQRSSGYLRIKRTRLRRGDNTQLAQISFVDNLTAASTDQATPSLANKPAPKKTATRAASTRKSAPKTAAQGEKS